MIDVKWLVVRLTGYDSPEIDSVSISVPGTDQPELIILLRVFQILWHYHYISHIVFSIRCVDAERISVFYCV